MKSRKINKRVSFIYFKLIRNGSPLFYKFNKYKTYYKIEKEEWKLVYFNYKYMKDYLATYKSDYILISEKEALNS